MRPLVPVKNASAHDAFSKWGRRYVCMRPETRRYWKRWYNRRVRRLRGAEG